MAYLTEALITSRVGGKKEFDSLTDDDGEGQTPDPGVVTEVTTYIDALVDGYAKRGGYVTPLVPGDAASIQYVLLDIANYALRSRGNRVASEDDRLRYEKALEVLEMIGKGEWQFPSGPATTSVNDFGLDSEERLFSRTDLWVM